MRYPHTSWNSAERRAESHNGSHRVFGGPTVTVANLAQHCPVEQGHHYCIVCCAVITDTPN